MDMIMSDQCGEERLVQWIQPHVVDVTCSIVDQEMELVKSRLALLMNHVTLNFINSWSLESTTGQDANELRPVLLRILERAAKSDRAQSRNKKKSSEQVCTILDPAQGFSTCTTDMLCHSRTAVKGRLSPQHQFPGHFWSISELQWVFMPDNKRPS